MVGEVLADRYELEELVGSGGMSSVYRAHDRLLDRKVALKILHQQYSHDEEYVERFRREARTVATLSHPNIVTVIDRGEYGGRQFIVLEYVDGENLKNLIERRGPAPVAIALELAIQIAGGLAFAHQRGLVHRDVKPQNVLLNGDMRAKVTDFGIARSIDVQHGMTQTGTVLGTSDYIAPEQAQGQRVDEHTDVYSLGVVLYEMLTSEVPFPGENFVAVAMRHINEEPPPVREKRPDVSLRLEAAICCAMAKRPEDRFATMEAFSAELQACLAETQAAGTQIAPVAPLGTQVTQAHHRRRSMSPWPVIVAIVALIAIGIVVALLILDGIPTSVPFTKSHSSSPPVVAANVRLSAVRSWDPDGDHREHDAQVGLATDGKVSTFWTTERYDDPPSLGKPGVGIVLDAHRSVKLNHLGISSGTPGFTAEILAGDSENGPFPAVVGASQLVSGATQYDIAGAAHRYYVIWITSLGSNHTVQINAVERELELQLAAAVEALDRQVGEPLEQLAVRDAGLFEEPRVDARRGEAGDGVQLVDEHLSVLAHEEVGARHPLTIGRDEGAHRELLRPLDLLLADPRRHDEVHLALVVLRLEVVPLVVRHDDLAGKRRDRALRLPSTPTSTSIPCTNRSTSTFSSCSNANRTPSCSSETLCAFVMPTLLPRRAGLTKTGNPNGLRGSSPSLSVMFSVTGMSWSRMTDLKTSLSMQSAEASTPAPTYGTPASSSSPCTVPSSPNGPCRTGNTTSTSESVTRDLLAGKARGNGRNLVRSLNQVPEFAALLELPTAVPTDLDRSRPRAPLASSARNDALRRRDRDRVLARPAAEDDRDPPAHGVVVVAAVVVVPVPPGAPVVSWPTWRITVCPGVAGEPGFGSMERTIPSWLGSVTGS